MKYLLLLLLLTTTSVEAREVWREGEFAVWSADFIYREGLPFTMLQMGLEIPANGAVVLVPEGSFEIYLPCKKKWVKDEGIFVVIGCNISRTGDTMKSGPIVLYDSDECKEAHKVALMVRLPRMYPTDDCYPTGFRWVGGYFYEER